MTANCLPSEQEFFEESLNFITICQDHCDCPDHWHFMWASLKAAGLRRGIYHQYGVFRTVLADRIQDGSSIFIAGAADAGSLHVLHAAADGKQVDFTVMDRCQAPLTLLETYARQHAIRLTTRLGDISQLDHGANWDAILIHNTLILMDRESRIKTLKETAKRLARNGIILCNVRYNTPPDLQDPKLPADECISITQKLETVFANQPGVMDLVRPMIMPYVQAQHASLARRPDKAELTLEIAQAGLEVFARYPETTVMRSMVSDQNSALNLQAELLLLRHSVHPQATL